MGKPDTSLTGASSADGPPTEHTDTQIALKAISDFLKVTTQDDLWDILVTYSQAIGMDLLSYHHHAPELAQDHANVTVRWNGFPEGWIEKHLDSKLHLTNPILNIFAGRLRPMLWSEVDSLVPLQPIQVEYVAQLRTWFKGDGFGFPVFGPSGRNGYVGIAQSDRPLDDVSPLNTNRLHWVMQSFHIRWCELILFHMPQDFSLNARELKILESLALGMSDEIICGVVSASVDSVQLSIRNILKKMGVSDRPSAILRGIGAGLIDDEKAVSRTV